MHGGDERTGELFSYVELEARVRRYHPLRIIRAVVNEAHVALEREFAAVFARSGGPSIPPSRCDGKQADPHGLFIVGTKLGLEVMEIVVELFGANGADENGADEAGGFVRRMRTGLYKGRRAVRYAAAS